MSTTTPKRLSDVSIPDLAAPADTDLFYATQGGSSRRATRAQLREGLVKADGSVAFTAPQVGVTPTLDEHLATKGYVDGLGGGGGSPSSPWSGQYHPDRAPASGLHAASDEFNGGIGTWRWANQGSATETAEMDTAYLAGGDTADEELRARWRDSPGDVDFSFAAKVSHRTLATGANRTDAGIVLLATGTEGSPTKLYILVATMTGETAEVRFKEMSSYSVEVTTHAIWGSGPRTRFVPWYYLQLRYVSATKTLTAAFSADGYRFPSTHAEVLAVAPQASIGRVASSKSSATFYWFRCKSGTDYLVGS